MCQAAGSLTAFLGFHISDEYRLLYPNNVVPTPQGLNTQFLLVQNLVLERYKAVLFPERKNK